MLITHLSHLVGSVLQPVLERFDLGHHQAEFLPNHGLFDELLAKRLALMSPAEAEVHDTTDTGDHAAGDQPAFMVEIAHDDLEAQILLTQEILYRNFDVVKGDVGGASNRGVAGFDELGGKPFRTLDQEHGNPEDSFITSAHSGHEVISEGAVSDPFLGTVHDVELATVAELGRAGQASDIGSCVRVRNRQANLLLTSDTFSCHPFSNSFTGELDHWRQADTETGFECIRQSRRTDTGELLMSDQFVEIVEIFGFQSARQSEGFEVVARENLGGQDTGLAHFFIKFVNWSFSCFFPFSSKRDNMFGHELADGFTEFNVRLIIVSRMKAFHPGIGFTVRDFTDFAGLLDG